MVARNHGQGQALPLRVWNTPWGRRPDGPIAVSPDGLILMGAFQSLGVSMQAVVRDPVCGMEVDPETAPVSLQWEGQTYYFCCDSCLRRFLEARTGPSKEG